MRVVKGTPPATMNKFSSFAAATLAALGSFAAPAAFAADPSLCAHLTGGAYDGCMGNHSTGDVYGVHGGRATHPRAPQPTYDAEANGRTALARSIKTYGFARIGNCEANGDQSKSGGKTMGFYRPNTRTVTICTEVTGGNKTSAFWETTRHEAVHMAQHCATNLNSPIMKRSWLLENSSQSDQRFISQNYPKSHYWVELEAFTLENYSNQVIANLVNKACG